MKDDITLTAIENQLRVKLVEFAGEFGSHIQTEPFGTDASHITEKYVKKIMKLLTL